MLLRESLFSHPVQLLLPLEHCFVKVGFTLRSYIGDVRLCCDDFLKIGLV